LSVERWRWKLKGRKAPVENVWLAVTTADGRIVGHHAGIPISLKVQGSVHDGFVIVDAMTHPDFRRQGIFTALSEATYKAWSSANVAVILGLPNENLGSRTEHVGWQPILPLHWSRLLLRLDELARRPGRLPAQLVPLADGVGRPASRIWRLAWDWPAAPGITVARVDRAEVDGVGDRSWLAVGKRYSNCIVRDGSWLRWRFIEPPDVAYTLLAARHNDGIRGFLAYRTSFVAGRRWGTICALFVAPDDRIAASALVRRALADLSAEGCGTVVALSVPGSRLEGTLSARHFRRQPHHFEMMAVALDPLLRPALTGDPLEWHVSGSDFDVV
jgi:ribosomal protein S18 acetylase RimI-like enzyme